MIVTSWMDCVIGELNWVFGMQVNVKYLKCKDLLSFVKEEIDGYVKDIYASEKEKKAASAEDEEKKIFEEKFLFLGDDMKVVCKCKEM